MRAPVCYALTRIEEGAYGLWMEDVGTAWSENWSLERYRLAAYHLGYFNGRFVVSDTVPNEAWLGQSGWQDHVEASALALELLARHRGEAHVTAIYPPPIAAQLLALWQRRKAIIRRARNLSPLSMCHGDTSGRNLYDIDSKETVAIDWYYAGLAPLGEDVARCLGSSIHWFFRGRMDEAKDLFKEMGDGYVEGLHAAGFSGDAQAVRYAYRAVICTLYALQYVHNAQQMKDTAAIEQWAQSNYGCTGAEAMEHRRQMAAFFVELAREGGLL